MRVGDGTSGEKRSDRVTDDKLVYTNTSTNPGNNAAFEEIRKGLLCFALTVCWVIKNMNYNTITIEVSQLNVKASQLDKYPIS